MNNFGKVLVISFYSDWYEHSVNFVEQIASLSEIVPLSDVIFARCDAEKVPEVANRYSVVSVPCIVITESRKQPLAVIGNEAPALAWEKIEEAVKGFKNSFESEKSTMYAKIKDILEQPGVLMFIKGTPQDPECKFTR